MLPEMETLCGSIAEGAASVAEGVSELGQAFEHAGAETLEQRVADLEEGLAALFVALNALMERNEAPALRMGLEQRLAARAGLRTGG